MSYEDLTNLNPICVIMDGKDQDAITDRGSLPFVFFRHSLSVFDRTTTHHDAVITERWIYKMSFLDRPAQH